MENLVFNPATPESLDLERNKAKQEIAENLSLVLEACSKNNEEIHVVEEAMSAPLGKLSEIYNTVANKYKMLIGVLVFVVASQAVIDSAQAEKEAPLKEDSFEQSAENRDVMKKIAGFDVAQEAEKFGRHAKFYSPKTPTKFTIVHIGQSHNRPEKEVNYNFRNEIAKSQNEIGAFLAGTTSIKSDVFIEGYVVVSEDYMHSMREVVSHINSAQSFSDIEKGYHGALSSYDDEQSVAVINKITGSKLASIGFKEISPLVYSNGTQNLYLIETGYFPKDMDYTVPNETDSALAGAANILSINGQINIRPAETSEGNNKGFYLQNQLKEKGKTLKKFFVSDNQMYGEYSTLVKSNLSHIGRHSADYIKMMAQSESCKKNIECQKITKEIVEAYIPEIKKAVMDEREDIAVELIAEQAKTSTQNVFPLVYGSAHDFTRAILKWNKAHPEEQFNLVTVK